MEEFKLYIVEFEENCAIKPKIYSSDCIVGGNNWQPIMVITYDEYIFSANNEI